MSFDPNLLSMPAFEDTADLTAEVTSGSELPPEGEELTLKFTPLKAREGQENASERGVIAEIVERTDKKTGEKRKVLSIAFRYVAEVTEGPHEGKRYFGRMSNQTMTWKGNATEISAFIQKCGMGEILQPGVTTEQIVEALHACFDAQASIPGCKVKWTGQYVPETPDPTNPEKTIKNWKGAKEICKSMKAFPLKDPADPSKGHENKFAWPGDPVNGIPPTTIYAECKLIQLGHSK